MDVAVRPLRGERRGAPAHRRGDRPWEGVDHGPPKGAGPARGPAPDRLPAAARRGRTLRRRPHDRRVPLPVLRLWRGVVGAGRVSKGRQRAVRDRVNAIAARLQRLAETDAERLSAADFMIRLIRALGTHAASGRSVTLDPRQHRGKGSRVDIMKAARGLQ